MDVKCHTIICSWTLADPAAGFRGATWEGQSRPGLDLSFAGSQGEYHCMWRCPRPGLNPSGLVNNSSLAAGPQFTEMKIL